MAPRLKSHKKTGSSRKIVKRTAASSSNASIASRTLGPKGLHAEYTKGEERVKSILSGK